MSSPSLIAQIKHIHRLSKTVKGFALQIQEHGISFQPGQWVDLVVDGISEVAGYSMTSSPQLLRQHGQLHLAVKFSDHPVTNWTHSQCKIGSKVSIKIGGDFYYKPTRDPILLLAGGVGINPMYSMLQHLADESCDQPVTLLYSAADRDELVFLEEIQRLKTQLPSLNCRFFVTKEECEQTEHTSIKFGRISQDDIKQAINGLTPEHLQSYVCGPTSMIDTMELYLRQLGVKDCNIHSERWW